MSSFFSRTCGTQLGAKSAHDVAYFFGESSLTNVVLITLDGVSMYDRKLPLWYKRCRERIGFWAALEAIKIQPHFDVSRCPRLRNLRKPIGINKWVNIWIDHHYRKIKHTTLADKIAKAGDYWGRQN